jgi:hypothetical protein
MKTKHLVIAPLLSCLFACANAATVSYSFDTLFSNDPVAPDASGPWLQMTTTDTIANQVTLTFTALNLTDPEHVTDWYINVDPSLDLNLLTFTVNSVTGTFANPSIAKLQNGHIADSAGLYDVHFSFETNNSNGGSNRFTDNDSLTYTVAYTGAGTFNSSSFSFLGTPEIQTVYGPFITGARILSTGPVNDGDAWVTPIPEPSVTLYSVLALGFAAGLRRRR